MKQPATDHISGAISRIELKVKNGKVKPLRVKSKTIALRGSADDVQKTLNDTVNPVKRNLINRKVRADYNPFKGAHNVVADVKKEISDNVRKDLENF